VDDLDPIARAGPGDVRGKSLLHLQCHFGMDTIRWARHGATVTGADFFVRAGLRITAFDEYPFMGWRFFPWMERGADSWWRLPEDPRLPLGRLPLMFSLKAIGPA
jgi:hypothetical protein